MNERKLTEGKATLACAASSEESRDEDVKESISCPSEPCSSSDPALTERFDS